MTEILFLIKPKNHSSYFIYMYGLVLLNASNTCCNLRLVILIAKNLHLKIFWFFGINYTFCKHSSSKLSSHIKSKPETF